MLCQIYHAVLCLFNPLCPFPVAPYPLPTLLPVHLKLTEKEERMEDEGIGKEKMRQEEIEGKEGRGLMGNREGEKEGK